MLEASHLTPMFRQYRALKRAHAGTILLFRMGDFYEMFHEDAQEASRLLGLTLTARGKGTNNVAPMCGFPHHQLDAYTARLVRAGRRVAVCDQVEDPKLAKGLVRREVVRIVTPGTLTDIDQLDATDNAWLGAVAWYSARTGAAFIDASTGEFLAWQSPDEGDPWEALADRLASFSPAEIIHPEDFPWPEKFKADRTGGAVITPLEPDPFSPASAADLLGRHFGVASLDGFGMRERPAAVAAAGGLLVYLRDMQKSGLQHIDGLSLHEPSCFLLLDPATRRNLEIDRSIREGGRRGSLLHAVDATVTSAGARLLRRWLLAPLLDPRRIGHRHDALGEFLSRRRQRLEARTILQGIHDIERLLSRAVAGTANARDLQSLRHSVARLPELVEALAGTASPLILEILAGLDPCADVVSRLATGLIDDPPVGLREGGLIRDGFNTELDELRAIRRDGREYIASLEVRERDATGIASLKVRFNRVFGYYIEVSRSNLHLVPPRYRRKQTIAGGERYVTAELKEYETKVLHAQERIESLEYETFCVLRAEVASQAHRLKAAAGAVANLDVLSSLAEVAAIRDYRRPLVREATMLRITGGRHPVVEQTLLDGRFVANDTNLDATITAMAILTGPNMGGKSTFLRQVALIVLLAQSGSFVPAEEAEIGVVDRIFCRVGSSDSLAEGQSSFMVEMTETANILHHVTPRSLVLLDEIGRGTSTFDGLAIAWAIAEFLHSLRGGPPRTLFATHYHELTELAITLPAVVNLRMAVREWGEQVVFLHRVELGAADRSYGIHVAQLAGLPKSVIARAQEILKNLERDEFGGDGLPRRARRQGAEPSRVGAVQRPLFFSREDAAPDGPLDPVT